VQGTAGRRTHGREEEGTVITSIIALSFSLDGGSWCGPGKYLLISLPNKNKTNQKWGKAA